MIGLHDQKRRAVAAAAKDTADAIACLAAVESRLLGILRELQADFVVAKLSGSPDERAALVARAARANDLGRAIPTVIRMVHGAVASATALCSIPDVVANSAGAGDAEQVFDRPA